jgi:hypothetical protein
MIKNATNGLLGVATRIEDNIICLICVDLQKDKLTWKEARRNLSETYVKLEQEHVLEVLRLIWKKEDQESQESSDEIFNEPAD